MRPIKKPLVAGLSGYAVGCGLELALMCDLRVIEDTAQLGLLNRRYGKLYSFVYSTQHFTLR